MIGAYRILIKSDAKVLEAHLLGLPEVDRHSRFHSSLSEESIKKYVLDIKWDTSCLIGYFDMIGNLHGVVEIMMNASIFPANAELAVTVDSSLHGKGVGRELVTRAMTVARNRGIKTVQLFFLRANQQMKKIVSDFNPKLETDDGVVSATISLDSPTLISVYREMLDWTLLNCDIKAG